MKKILCIALCSILLVSCYKDEIDIEKLNNNPFDRDYVGPEVFEMIGTYVQTVSINGNTTQQQVIEFRVKEELFLAPASYSVQLTDPELNDQFLLDPDPPLSDRFKYFRADTIAYGEEICVDLRLSNNQSVAGKETICATL